MSNKIPSKLHIKSLVENLETVKDPRTLTDHLKKFGVPVSGGYFELADLLNAIIEYNSKYNDGRKTSRQMIDNQEGSISEDLEPLGELNIKDPATFKMIQDGLFVALKNKATSALYMPTDKVNRTMYTFTASLNVMLEAISTKLREVNKFDIEVLDELDKEVRLIREFIFNQCIEFAENISPYDDEVIAFSADAKALRVVLYVLGSVDLMKKYNLYSTKVIQDTKSNREQLELALQLTKDNDELDFEDDFY